MLKHSSTYQQLDLQNDTLTPSPSERQVHITVDHQSQNSQHCQVQWIVDVKEPFHPLGLSTLAVVIVTLLIGFTVIAGLFSMPVMPIAFLGWIAGLMVVYTVLAQIMKIIYIRINKEWV